MMRLIDADALMKELEQNPIFESHLVYKMAVKHAMSKVKDAPTIDAVPVRRGEWVGGELGHCTCCGHEGCASDIWNGVHGDGFCPNCGAKMGGAEE